MAGQRAPPPLDCCAEICGTPTKTGCMPLPGTYRRDHLLVHFSSLCRKSLPMKTNRNATISFFYVLSHSVTLFLDFDAYYNFNNQISFFFTGNSSLFGYSEVSLYSILLPFLLQTISFYSEAHLSITHITLKFIRLSKEKIYKTSYNL